MSAHHWQYSNSSFYEDYYEDACSLWISFSDSVNSLAGVSFSSSSSSSSLSSSTSSGFFCGTASNSSSFSSVIVSSTTPFDGFESLNCNFNYLAILLLSLYCLPLLLHHHQTPHLLRLSHCSQHPPKQPENINFKESQHS